MEVFAALLVGGEQIDSGRQKVLFIELDKCNAEAFLVFLEFRHYPDHVALFLIFPYEFHLVAPLGVGNVHVEQEGQWSLLDRALTLIFVERKNEDLLDVGLIDSTWLARLPPELADRLRQIIETPDG